MNDLYHRWLNIIVLDGRYDDRSDDDNNEDDKMVHIIYIKQQLIQWIYKKWCDGDDRSYGDDTNEYEK